MGRTSGSTSSTSRSASITGRLRVGRVVGAHGLRGQLRVRSDGDASSWLTPGAELLLAGQGAAEGTCFSVQAAAPGRREEWRVSLEGVGDRTAAEALRGREVFVEPAALAPLEEGEVYGYQLLGCRVDGEDGTPVGRVVGFWRTGADLLVVEGEGGREHLVPVGLLRSVDAEARRAVIEILPGLLEAADA